jgi:zinc protease
VKRLYPLLATATLALASLAHAADGGDLQLLDTFLRGVQKEVLPNGLTLITREDRGSGVVAINTLVKAGYFNEPDEVAGMAHLFEHMFFKGSKRFPGSEQIAREISSIGGRTNAGTIYDSTSYYIVVPREGFQRAVEIQADAVMNPLFDPQELAKEAEVVIEESNRKLDNPAAVSLERMFATQFTQHRMRRWRIGSNEVLRNIERDDLLAFFETLYRPENMIVSIAGDVGREEARAIVLDSFGTMPRGTLDKQRGPSEPAQTEFRYGSSTADMSQGYSVLGWHAGGVGSPDEMALDLLASILGQGRSSRLFVNAVGSGAANTSSAAHYTFDDVGVFFVQSTFDEPNRAEADRRVLAEVERLKAHGPTDEELQRAKNLFESAIAFSLQDALGQARTLADSEANYGYAALSERLRQLNALTRDDLTRVARRYLTVDGLTLYHYAPTGTALPGRDAALASVRAAAAAVPPAPAAASAGKPPVPVEAATADEEAAEMKLANGMTLVVKPRTGAPVVSVSVYFPGGRTAEDSGNAGITSLMARSLQKGTRSRSGQEIDRQVEFLGTSLDVEVDADYFGLGIDLLARNYRAGLDLLADMLLNPAFPEEGVMAEKQLQLGAIRRAYDSSSQRPLELALEALYRGHPYGLPASGYESSLARLGKPEVQDWWASRVAADGALVVVVGDISSADAKQSIEAAFKSLPRRSSAAPLPAATTPLPARLDVIEYRDRKQSAMAYAFPGVPRSHPDWARLRLLRYVTSGLAGTFFAELRGRRSLAYTVFAGDFPNASAGAFIAYIATEAAKEDEAREALLAELRRLGEDGFGAGEVSTAQSYYAGSTLIALETNSAQAADLARNWFCGLPLDYTRQSVAAAGELTVAELQDAARRYLTGDRFALAIVRGKQ